MLLEQTPGWEVKTLSDMARVSTDLTAEWWCNWLPDMTEQPPSFESVPPHPFDRHPAAGLLTGAEIRGEYSNTLSSWGFIGTSKVKGIVNSLALFHTKWPIFSSFKMTEKELQKQSAWLMCNTPGFTAEFGYFDTVAVGCFSVCRLKRPPPPPPAYYINRGDSWRRGKRDLASFGLIMNSNWAGFVS